MGTGPQLKVSYVRLEKLGVGTCHFRLQGEWFIHCTTIELPQAFVAICIFRNAVVSLLNIMLFFFGLILFVSVNSYGHVGMISSPNHTFVLGKLD